VQLESKTTLWGPRLGLCTGLRWGHWGHLQHSPNLVAPPQNLTHALGFLRLLTDAGSFLTINPLESSGNYSATSNNMKLVHWPLMGGPLDLVQRGGDWAGPQPIRPLHAVPNVTAHPSTASVPITVLLYNASLLCGFNVPIKGQNAADNELSITFHRINDTRSYVVWFFVDGRHEHVLSHTEHAYTWRRKINNFLQQNRTTSYHYEL